MNQATLIKPLHTYSKEELLAIGRKLSRLTQDNDHTQAYIEVAKYLQSAHFVSIFTGIQMIHNAEGHLPAHIAFYRDSAYEELMDLGYSEMGNSFEKIHQSL